VVHGYVWYARRSNGIGLLHDLVTSDLCVIDRDGALALAAFLHRHRSMVRDVVWYGGAHDAFRDALSEIGAATSLASTWMIRIVDVERAFLERGFPRALSGTLEIEIEDALLGRNHGRFVVHVENGTAHVERGGAGRLFVPVTDLAAIFTGYASAESRARFGRVRGSESDLALLTSLCAGPSPAMPDMF
jgi:predicted acetyltransferase